MKYIDAEKLKAEIRKLRSESCISESDDYYEYAKSEIIDIIDSFQQEQPDVDLEKEIQKHIIDCLDVKFPTTDIELIKTDVEYTARKFYELGLNARNK